MNVKVKRIIGYIVLAIIVISVLVFLYTYYYVPAGQSFKIIYSNLQTSDPVGYVEEEMYELHDHGFRSRTKFLKPGDACEYVFDVKNDGTVDGVLKKDPIYLKLDMYTKKHVELKLTYNDKEGTPVKKGDIIPAGDSVQIRVRITYKHEAEFATANSQLYETSFFFAWAPKK